MIKTYTTDPSRRFAPLKNVRLRSILLLLSVCLSQVAAARADTPGELVIYTEQFPPYNFQQGGAITGINIELVEILCAKLSLNCRFELVSWNRAYNAARQQANAGLVSTSRLAERESLFQWVGPLVTAKGCLFKLRSRSDIQVVEMSDIKQYSFGLMRNDIYQLIFDKWGFKAGEDYLLFGSKHEEAQAFVAGKLDLMVASVNTLPYQLDHVGLDYADVEPVWLIDDPTLKGNHLALNHAVPAEVIADMQRALDDLRDKGIVRQLTYRYQPPLKGLRASDHLRDCL